MKFKDFKKENEHLFAEIAEMDWKTFSNKFPHAVKTRRDSERMLEMIRKFQDNKTSKDE